jgi:hypothetical protein
MSPPRLSLLSLSRAASLSDSRVGRDHDEVKQRLTESEVDKCLAGLWFSRAARPKNPEAAEELLRKWWPRFPVTADVRNNTGCALAWLRCWDDALAELSAVIDGGDEGARTRARRNRNVILRAREKARQ